MHVHSFSRSANSYNLTSDIDTLVVLNDIGTILTDLVPVDDIPPVGNILWTTILIFEIVGMFPHIQSENRKRWITTRQDSLHEWIVLIGGIDNFQLVTLADHDPHPSRSKGGTRCGLGLKGSLHFVHAAKGLVNEFGQLLRWLALLGLTGWSHFVPEKGMIVMSTTTVADTGSSIKGVGHEIKDGNFVAAFGGLVDVGHVGGMMLVVVDLHGGSINVGFKGVEGIIQVGDRVGVGNGRDCGSGETGGFGKDGATGRARSVCCVYWGVDGGGIE